MSAYTENQRVEQPGKGLFAELDCQKVRQTQHLRWTRDLLLPRLLSGQVNLAET
jgi:hypothetical protein